MIRKFITIIIYLALFSVKQIVFAQSSLAYQALIEKNFLPLMHQNNVPGLAIALTVNGKDYFYNYGIASKENKRAINSNTLFEIGSVTKTFTATLASYLAQQHKLNLRAGIIDYLPEFKGSKFAKTTLLELATHTSGLPLITPEHVKTKQQLQQYLRRWHPPYRIGTHRVYSNIGIGVLGFTLEKVSQKSYRELLQQAVLQPLHMHHTFIEVPASEFKHYAQGYDRQDHPTRIKVNEMLLPAADGLKSSSKDLLKFVKANIQAVRIPVTLKHAINQTHQGYFKTPFFIQDMVWEQYATPLSLEELVLPYALQLDSSKAQRLQPIIPAGSKFYINKTGSTNGFSSYVAFIPSKQVGIVVLANKTTPTAKRISAAFKVLNGILS